ncbi:MAG: ABC transporter substrate-binding protein, partial [Atopobiaceae bacterium]|nr:ABC transporter substrate-binding protein [Atopobiaceae bacterium]
MISRRTFVSAAFGTAAATLLAACGGSKDNAASSDAAASGSTVLSVAATPEPHAKILTEYAAPKLAEQQITLEVKEFTDYVQPNEVVYNGEIDCNYFQHINYLNDYNEQNGEDLVSVAKIHYEPFGIYAGKSSDLAAIADGAVIAVPNDPTNEARALLLLQQAGLIKLKDPDNIAATPNDITDNPHNITFREIEAAATPRALEDVDFAAINGNYAQEAGLHAADALVLEEASGVAFEQYANIICT